MTNENEETAILVPVVNGYRVHMPASLAGKILDLTLVKDLPVTPAEKAVTAAKLLKIFANELEANKLGK